MGPIQNSVTKRPTPLALNHLELRGGHFDAVLKEYASSLVTKPGGCALLQGPFALSLNGALRKVLHTWGSCITLKTQRKHATYTVERMVAFQASSNLLSSFALEGNLGLGHGQGRSTRDY